MKDNDQDIESPLPGYPHYPAKDDITRPRNNNGRENVNDESIPGSNKINEAELDKNTAYPARGESGDDIVMGTEADVTDEDIQLLENAEQNSDTEDGRNLMASALDETDDDGDPLNEEGAAGSMTGEGLDVPGGELDDADENEGEEDEENNYYSLGGDNHESQEENKGE